MPIRVEIAYMDIYACYFIPLARSNFYEAEDLYYKEVKTKSICDSINYFQEALKTNSKSKFQQEIDPRVAVQIIYPDSSTIKIFVDVSGEYMFDTSGTVYAHPKQFIKYLERIIDDPIAKWSKQ